MLPKLNIFAREYSGVWLGLVLYSVEFLDELIYGMHGAVLPFFKTDLALTYTQVGLLFTVPGLGSIFAEPIIGLLGDTRHRRAMVLGGIAATVASLFFVATGQTYLVILGAFSVMASASGAYVTLAQATLIDLNPDRAEQTMARWVLLGAVAVTVAPLIATAAFYFGYSWRGLYFGLAGTAGLYMMLLLRQRFDAHAGAEAEAVAPRRLWAILIKGLKNAELLKWVLITELADLMLDKLTEVTGLYFHDVVGVSLTAASGAAAWASTVGLVGSIALVPIVERVSGVRLLRITGSVVLLAYVAFLLAPVVWLKYALIGLISFCTASWFPTLRAKSFQALPSQSGVVMAVSSLANVSSLFVPFVIGHVADLFGLGAAMWLLALGPAALIVGLPHGKSSPISDETS